MIMDAAVSLLIALGAVSVMSATNAVTVHHDGNPEAAKWWKWLAIRTAYALVGASLALFLKGAA